MEARDYKKAVEVLGSKGFLTDLLEICRSLNKKENAAEIRRCAEFFRQHKNHA